MEKVAPILLQGTSNKFSDNFLNGSSILQCHRSVGETMALSIKNHWYHTYIFDSGLWDVIHKSPLTAAFSRWTGYCSLFSRSSRSRLLPTKTCTSRHIPYSSSLREKRWIAQHLVLLLLTLVTVRVELGSSLPYRGVDAKHLPPSLIEHTLSLGQFLANFLVSIGSLHDQCRWILFGASSEVQHVE